jgi:adenosylcobyric acid synthase
MVQGTASTVGKSTLVAGLCRLFARRGVRVAPFKAQNMSNNAAVCAGGGEIGRAQYAQALAAGITPVVDMNPILLKPQGNTCQVVVLGKVADRLDAEAYFCHAYTERLWPVVVEALDGLRRSYELVIAEGAGSPAEINLRDRDVVNMRVALHANAQVLLVADIDKGGAFAALLGTWHWLEPAERALVRGFVLNKFRGDARLLAPAPELLETRTGVPVIGIVPFLDDLGLADEDAASLSIPTDATSVATGVVDIAVVRLPHLANFDEFGPLGAEHGVSLRYVRDPAELRAPDLIVLPGTKATIPDLKWLSTKGLADRIRWLVTKGTPVLGVCGGFQMLGRTVRDPLRIESDQTLAPGLGLLPVETELASEKQLQRVRGRFRHGLSGIWGGLGGLVAEGYEIHMGRTAMQGTDDCGPFVLVDGCADGLVSQDGIVAGTSIHGLFEQRQPREALVKALAAARGYVWHPADAKGLEPYDVIADALEANLRLDGLDLRRVLELD